MRSLVAAFLLLLQLGPPVALGLCVIGTSVESSELDCPMSQPDAARQVATSKAAAVSALDVLRQPFCCSIDDLCTFSAPAIMSPRPVLTVIDAPRSVTLSWSNPLLVREPTAPPSPPPNS